METLALLAISLVAAIVLVGFIIVLDGLGGNNYD